MKDVRGKTVLVTGGAGGIGMGIALAFAEAGAHIAIADLNPEVADADLDSICRLGVRAEVVSLDVRDAAAWSRAADQVEASLGPVDILCNNAGVGPNPGPAEHASLNEWRWVFEVNVEAHLLGFQTFLPRMRARGGPAHFIHTISMSGLLPTPNMPAYVSSKYAALGLAEHLRQELADSGIGISVLLPGIVRTNIFASAERARPANLGRNERILSMPNPLDKGMSPQHVGKRVVEGLNKGDFYIFTHADWRPMLQNHVQNILAGYGDVSADPNHRDDFDAFAFAFEGND